MSRQASPTTLQEPTLHPKTRNKALLLAALALAVGLFFAFDLGRYFSLAAVQSAQDDLARRYDEQPLLFIAVYALIYIAAFALALPVGTPLTLAGGALFGFWVGVVVVSFASTIGATLAFLGARYLLGDAARARFGTRLAEVDKGIAREGGFYLFTLRLIPLFPPALLSVPAAIASRPTCCTPMRIGKPASWLKSIPVTAAGSR